MTSETGAMTRGVLPPDTPELRALDLFSSVVSLGSLSKAAQAHHISQPSASARIRMLERRLKVTLLERTPSGSVPTTAGKLVIEWSVEVLDATRRLMSGVEALLTSASDRLRIGASYTIAEHLMPHWLASFRLLTPESAFELVVINSSAVTDKVLRHEVDLGFTESVRVREGLASTVVARDELVLVVDSAHAWRRRQTPLPASVLAGTPLVLRESGSGTREVLESALERAGFTALDVALELGSTAAVKNAVANGVAPAVLSRLAISQDIALGILFTVPVAGIDLRRELRAVWHPVEPLSATAQAFLRHVSESQ